MRTFINVILIFTIVVFALFNYQFITFSNGISKPNYDDMTALEAVQNHSESINSVAYYKKTLSKDTYRVLIKTDEAAYLLDASKGDIDAISATVKARKVFVVPFYVEVALGLLVLILPFGRPIKKLKKDKAEKAK